NNIRIPGDFTEIHVNRHNEVQLIQGPANLPTIGNGLQRLKAVDNGSPDGVRVLIHDGVGQHLGIAMGSVGNGEFVAPGAVEAGRLDLGKVLFHVFVNIPPAGGLGAFLEEQAAL